MQQFGTQHPTLFVVFLLALVAVVWIVIGFLISLMSGWHSLAERYKTEREFPVHKRAMQRAQMRAACNYNNILTLASDAEGLYMGMTIPMFPGHPRLFIPWSDIAVEEPQRWFFFMTRRLRLGPDRIPLRVREPLAEFLLEPRGAGGNVSQSDGMKWGV